MIKFRKTNKKHFTKVYLAQIVIFILSMFFVGMGVYAQSPENASGTYKITLPQKVDGIEKLEYVINDKNMGSTAGTENSDVNSGSVINFLVQIESEGYSQLCAKDIKLSTTSGKSVSLMKYMCNKNGDLTKVALTADEVLDANQTYITSDYKVTSDDTFTLGNLEKDSFGANINVDTKDYSANESLNVTYSLDKSNEKQAPVYNKGTNSFEIPKITFGTPVTLTINLKENFSQSEPKIFIGENEIIPFSDGSITLPAVKSDVNITVKNVKKNRYSLSFENYEDVSFEYRKQGDEGDFASAAADVLEVISGESYDFKCTPKSKDALSNKEITANGIALKKANDVYSVSNIKEDVKIAVTSLEDTCYNIALPDENLGAVITDESGSAISSAKAKYGDAFRFKIAAKEGYENGINDASIYAIPTNKLENGDYDVNKNPEEAEKYLINPSSTDEYVISEVKEPISLIVKNLLKNSYKVRFPEKLEGASYKVESSEGVSQLSEHAFSVVRGSKLIVTLTADEGKSIDNATIGCNNSSINVSKYGNKYTIENITDDSDIIIGDIEDKVCNVTFDSDGITCADENGSVFSNNTIPVNYKGSAKFTVGLNQGYDKKSEIALRVTSGNGTLTKLSEENSYEISNITDNIKISVTGVTKKKIQLRLTSIDSSAVFRTTDGKSILEEVNNVEYGSNFEFEVISQNSENQTYSIQSSGGDCAIEKFDGYSNGFVVKNITSDVTLSAIAVFDSETDAQNGTSSPKKLSATRNLQTRGLGNTVTTQSDNNRDANESLPVGTTRAIRTGLTGLSNWYYNYTGINPELRQEYYFYDNNKIRSDELAPTLFEERPYNLSLALGENGYFRDFGEAQPENGADRYDVTYTKQEDGSWSGYYQVKFRTEAKDSPNTIQKFILSETSSYNAPINSTTLKNGYSGFTGGGVTKTAETTDAYANWSVSSQITELIQTPYKSSKGIEGEGSEITLKIKVSITGHQDVLDNEITNMSDPEYDWRIQICDHIDMHVQRQYIDSVPINTKLTSADNVFAYYYEIDKNDPTNSIRHGDYTFKYNADPYNPNASYIDLTNESSNANTGLHTGFPNEFRKRSDNGYWEGTYGVRFKANANSTSDIIDKIELFGGRKGHEDAPTHGKHTTETLVQRGQEFTAMSDDRVKYKILECDSMHSTKDPGAEEYILQIKVTIEVNMDNYWMRVAVLNPQWDGGTDYNAQGVQWNVGDAEVSLFRYFDIRVNRTTVSEENPREYDLCTLEKLIQFRPAQNSGAAASFTFINGDQEGDLSKTETAPEDGSGIATMNLADNTPPLNKIKLKATQGRQNPGNSFTMKFKITASRADAQSQGSTIDFNPVFSYISEDGMTVNESLQIGKSYTIITAQGVENRYSYSNYATPTNIYNKVKLYIDDYSVGGVEYDTNDGSEYSREFTVKGTCELVDYSCSARQNNDTDLGYLFEGHEKENNYVGSYIEYNADTNYVPSDISFENTHNAAFFKVGPEEEITDEEITSEIHLNSGISLPFALKVKDNYKFVDEVIDNPLKCIKINSKTPDGKDCTVIALETNVSAGYVKYEISGVTKENIAVSINPHMVDSVKYTGSFEGKYSSYKTTDGAGFDHHSFKYGDDNFKFVISPSEEAQGDPERFNVIINGNLHPYKAPTAQSPSGDELSTSDGKFSMTSKYTTDGIEVELAGIQLDFTIIVDYDRKDIPITFNTDGKFSYVVSSPVSIANEGEISTTATKKVKYGQSLSFVIKADDSIDTTDAMVTSSGVPIYMVNSKYTIRSITSEQSIEVSNVSTINNTVTFTRYDDVTFKDLESKAYAEKVPVAYGQDIQFRIGVSEGFSASENDMQVWAEFASGKKTQFGVTDPEVADYDEKTNLYTLKGVKDNVRVYIENLEPNTYTIKFDNSKNNAIGIEYFDQYGTKNISGSEQKVSHGEDFSFKVVAKNGYDLSHLKIYDREGNSGNAKQILPAHDVYTITNITNDHTITAQDATLLKCKIEFRTLQGASCVDSSGNTISDTVEVDYGSDYKFKLSLDKAYNKSTPTVNIKGTAKPLTKGADGIYTISGIKEDKIIEITNVKKNAYTATFKNAEGVIYKTAKNKPFTGSQTVEYNENLYFKISLMDAYDKSIPRVLLNGDKPLVENSGVYNLENIRDDVVVTVENVVKNPEEVGISDISNIPTEVSSESDVDSVINATKTYMSLSDEEKEQVTNIDDLKKAQENAGRINHFQNDVEISGVDWNIKLVVNPLNDDKEKMSSFEEKLERRSLLSLYEIHLVDLLTGKDYEVPYGQEVSVILPAPDLSGYTNEVVAHEKSSGSMEYLDINIVDGRAQFQTSSFSMFGIAAKKIQNYVEDPSDMKISVNSLVENDDELKSLLGDNLVSQLGRLVDDETTDGTNKNDGNDSSQTDNTSSDDSSSSSEIKKLLGGIDLEDTYNWILDNELAAVIVILLIGSLLVWLLLALARKKKKDEEEEKATSKK